MTEYRHTVATLAAELNLTPRTVRDKAHALGLGIHLAGNAGYRFTDADRAQLIKSYQTEPVVVRRRKRRRAA